MYHGLGVVGQPTITTDYGWKDLPETILSIVEGHWSVCDDFEERQTCKSPLCILAMWGNYQRHWVFMII
jgi:hypothetical protein